MKRVDLPADHLSRIGTLCVRWAELEMSIERWILILSDPQSDAEAAQILGLTVHLGMRERIGGLMTMAAVARPESEKAKRAIKKLGETIVNDLRIRRNTYVHKRWTIIEETVGQFHMSGFTGLKAHWEDTPLSALDALISEIQDAIASLDAICEELIQMPPFASPDTSS